MNKWKNIFIIIAGLALVASACFISWSYGFRQGIKAGGLTSSIAELMLVNSHVEDQFSNANCEGVRQAINDYIKLIEKYKNKDDVLLTETVVYGDLMRGNLRLARIDRHEGKESERAQHLAIARAACAQRKWTDCSEEKLLWFSKRTDQNHPIACLGND